MIGRGYEVAATLYARRVQTRHGGFAEAEENRYRLRGEPGCRGTAVDGEEAVGAGEAVGSKDAAGAALPEPRWRVAFDGENTKLRMSNKVRRPLKRNR